MAGLMSVATLALTLLVGGSRAHKLGVGACQNIDGMPDFDVSQFYGRWYINQIYASINTCMTLNFTEKANAPGEIKVSQGRQLVGLDAVDIKHTSTYAGTANIGNTVPSQMTIKWPGSGLFGTMQYTILDTDYTTYAATFECQRILFVGRWYSVTILSKEPTLPQAQLDEIRQKITSLGLDTSSLKTVSQETCTKPGDGFNINTDPDDFNLLGLISDEKIAQIQTEDEFITELGKQPTAIVPL